MALELTLAAFLLTIVAFSVNGESSSSLESVPDLEKAMYVHIEGYPCVRLLNTSGEIGCSNPGRDKVVAPILRLKSSRDQLSSPSTILVSLEEMRDVLLRIPQDPNFAQNVAGILVEATESHKLSSGFSPVEKFPQAEFAPYQNRSYVWNPDGSSIMWNHYNFPVFLLSAESTTFVQEVVSKNEKHNSAYTMDVAEFDLAMQTTNAGTHDSESCLKEHTCLPLGGYSVWSSLPPINISKRKPILLVSASQDSASFFHDKSLGANSPLSGLIAMLAAVDALSHVSALDDLQKQLVFVAFTGESWGYLGSRRFLLELDLGSDALDGLDSTLIEQVVELGSVGKGLTQDNRAFYAHVEGNSSATKEIISAFQTASESLGSDNVKIKRADASNPGVPPSSLMSFIRKNSSISGMVLEDFDASFTNKLYHSHLDDISNINSSSVAAAAILVARALYVLATGHSALDLIELNSIKVNVSLVEELVGCLLTCQPGLSCGIVKSFINPSSICPSHYVGVFVDSPANIQFPQYADDTSRFIWNFLADKNSIPKENSSSCTGGLCSNGEICVGVETESGGRCAISTTRYVPAYSTRLNYDGHSWNVIPANSSDEMGSADPIWTESYWNTIGLRVYTVQSATYDRLVFISGVVLTVGSYIAAVAIRTSLSKAIKQD